ncbi:MAG: NUDIX hydrolase [Pseudohongiellaceae bacterium]
MTEMKPVPAATVAVVRENTQRTDLEVLLLLRNARLVFLGGHWVFPGGRIDADDFAAADDRLEYPAARLAAVREAREEAGLQLDPERLLHTAHWTTPPNLPRRFSTWFFVYPLSETAAVCVDNDEILDYRWLTPRQALAEAEARRLALASPTVATLGDLCAFRCLADLLAAVAEGNIRVHPQNSCYYRPAEMGFSG